MVPRKHGSTETGKPPPTSPHHHEHHGTPAETGVALARLRFDPAAKADQKYTLAFSTEELEAIEDVKLELRRRFDVKTTKVELVRCGLWDLLEDYRHHGDRSRVFLRLKARKHTTI